MKSFYVQESPHVTDLPSQLPVYKLESHKQNTSHMTTGDCSLAVYSNPSVLNPQLTHLLYSRTNVHITFKAHA